MNDKTMTFASNENEESTPPAPAVWDEAVLAGKLKGELRSLERFRQEVLAKRRKGWSMLLTALLISVLGGLAFAALEPVFGLAGVLGFVVAAAVINHKFFGSGAATYRLEYKKRIIGGMTRAVSPEMGYYPEQGLSEEWFNSSGLHASPDRYHSEDLFEGRIGKTSIWFSEVHAEDRRTRTDSKGRTETYYVTIFKGLMVVADFHKNFRSELAVLPDMAERTFGWLGRKLQKLGGDLQRMENPEFERAFVVRGKDAVEARYILTPDMQERILSLRGRLGEDVRFAFKQSHIFMTFSNKDDWFEPKLKTPAEHLGQMRGFLGQMATCFNIVRDLDLNTRIWTRE